VAVESFTFGWEEYRLSLEREQPSLKYTDAGSGFPLLFIHGHPFDRSMWLPQIASLRWKYRIIAPDLPAYGSSMRRDESAVTQEMLATDLARLLDRLEIERACVVGLSMGGQIAMEFARAFPQKTSALVLAATSARPETDAGVVERNRIADRILAEGVVPVGVEMLSKLLGPKTLKTRPSVAADVFGMISRVDAAGAAAIVRGRALRQDYRPSLAEFAGPALMVVGTDDAYTPVADAQEIHTIMRDCHLEVFEGVGHLPNLEAEDRFNRCLHTFLDRLEEER
jgi:pimeloyl-ACP methyl ester carboxylesterase